MELYAIPQCYSDVLPELTVDYDQCARPLSAIVIYSQRELEHTSLRPLFLIGPRLAVIGPSTEIGDPIGRSLIAALSPYELLMQLFGISPSGQTRCGVEDCSPSSPIKGRRFGFNMVLLDHCRLLPFTPQYFCG